MEDRFKFRVWDKVSKRYFFLELKFGDNGYHPLFIEKPIFEQCTGLKDKNSKLIYEGDIVRCGKTGQFVYKVSFNKRFASFVLIRKEDTSNHYFGEAVEAEDVEVIGNIHENPDLLEVVDVAED